MTKQKKENEKQDTKARLDAQASPPVFTIDFEEFAHFFEGEEVAEEEARGFLKLYWEIACELMSLGFGFHPVQQAQKACGKDAGTRDALPLKAPDSLYLNQNYISENFEQAAGPKSDRTGKESRHDAV